MKSAVLRVGSDIPPLRSWLFAKVWHWLIIPQSPILTSGLSSDWAGAGPELNWASVTIAWPHTSQVSLNKNWNALSIFCQWFDIRVRESSLFYLLQLTCLQSLILKCQFISENIYTSVVSSGRFYGKGEVFLPCVKEFIFLSKKRFRPARGLARKSGKLES